MEFALSGQTETFQTKVLSQDFIFKPTILEMVLAQHCLEDGLTLMCFSQEGFFAEHPPLTTLVKVIRFHLKFKCQNKQVSVFVAWCF